MSVSAAEKIRDLRLTSKIDEALMLASEELGKNQSSALLAEAIRVLILKEQHANAVSLYRVFTADPSVGNNLEPEALVRLALQMGRRELLEKMQVPAGPSWLVELLTSGQDPLGHFQPVSLDVTVSNGPAVYTFQGPCPHCGLTQVQAVATSLLVLRHWFCPSCFGSARLDLATVRTFLKTNHMDLLKRGYFDLDAPLLEHLRPMLVGEKETEEIIRALGQEYVFLLNELIVWHSTSDVGTGEA